MEVKLEGLSKTFGRDVIAVNNLNLEVPDGEFIVLLGPSGCGKTTTMRMIAGLEKPDKGKIIIGERIVNDLPPKGRNVAMVFQNFALYPTMSVYENIAFPLRVRKAPKESIDTQVKQVAKLLNISTLLKRKPQEVSGGQAQRVALARALVRNPDLFLMDEPLSNLDAKLRIQMRIELQTLHNNVHTTTIYVTHDQEEAMTLADKIVVMNEGQIQQLGTPHEVYFTPANLFVAGFVGSPPMNMFEGIVQEDNNVLILKFADFTYKLSPKTSQILKKEGSTDIIAGIRPDTFKIASSENNSRNILEGTVMVIELLGTRQLVSVVLGEKTTVTMILDSAISLHRGNRYPFMVPETWLYLFDKASGKAVAQSKERLDIIRMGEEGES
ncbi:MAG: ABC transporter ATP-binding protein [Actinobacteria bacterium]|nr:ABC transporter ATP-binding protein [Actinomycetota bacterium]